VLGEEFAAALAEWPWAQTRILARARLDRVLRVEGELAARLEEIVWLLARYFGRLEGGGIALPAELDARVLGRLTAAEPQAVVAALAVLAVTSASGGGLQLPAPGPERGEQLRARATEQFVIARAASAEYVLLTTAPAHRVSPSSS
jgi:hypothetical protein